MAQLPPSTEVQKWRVRESHPAIKAYETLMSTGPPASKWRKVKHGNMTVSESNRLFQLCRLTFNQLNLL